MDINQIVLRNREIQKRSNRNRTILSDLASMGRPVTNAVLFPSLPSFYQL